MKKSVKVRFNGKMFFSVFAAGLILIALMVSFPASAQAGDDSAGDSKLHAMKADLMACLQSGATGQTARIAFSQKYNVPLSKLNENVPAHPPASDGGWDRTTAYWVCFAEYWGTASVGAGVWDLRQVLDGVNCGGWTYCTNYSMQLDHWNWQKGKLKEKMSNVCAN